MNTSLFDCVFLLSLKDKSSVPIIEKKLVELEIGLTTMLENSEILELQLDIHPTVKSIVQMCKNNNNRKPKVEDYDEKTHDSNFLNQLQSGVNKWVKEIQNVSICYSFS